MIDMWTSDLDFEVPRLPAGRAWFRAVDTSAAPPADVPEEDPERQVPGDVYHVAARSLAVLIGRSV